MSAEIAGSLPAMLARGPGSTGPSRTCGTGRRVLPSRLALPSPPGGLALPVLPGALCKGQDPALWFPGPGGSAEAAKAVCRACPVRVRCLEWAVQADEQAGVWGGASPDERALIRRERRQGPPPS
jgi:WhiB family redox-sensing transcriptional regulator